LLALLPFGLFPYAAAFISYDVGTLIVFMLVVYFIVRRSSAVALVLASPYTLWNFLAGANGFLTASLLGASLLTLERRPILGGVVIGCLTYKPQFGILFPVALLACNQWRAILSAIATTAMLASLSIVAFGTELWAAYPGILTSNAGLTLGANSNSNWGYLQTVYGLARFLHSGADLAWCVQVITTMTLVAIVWVVWRSSVRYPLKAGILSVAALLATPYAFAYDLAATAIPVAFLAKDQLERGLLRGEQITMLALFCLSLGALVLLGDSPHRMTFGGLPLGPVLLIALLVIVIRRASGSCSKSAAPIVAHE
jgi:arabinofuranan 3-O-arabinosyltransferase